MEVDLPTNNTKINQTIVVESDKERSLSNNSRLNIRRKGQKVKIDAKIIHESHVEHGNSTKQNSSQAISPSNEHEYMNDIFHNLLKAESESAPKQNYVLIQPEINDKMRAILVDWLIEVHHKFKLRSETMFITVNIIDRFLEK